MGRSRVLKQGCFANTMARSRSSAATSVSTPGPDILTGMLSSRVRAAVLGFLIAREEERFSLTELAYALDLSISSVQHECYKLEGLRVLKGRREGASRRYRLDRETPFVPALIEFVRAVLGRERLLVHVLVDVEGLYGALLTMAPAPQMILIGDLGLEELEIVQDRAAATLGVDAETLDLAFYDSAAWNEHRAHDSSLITGLRSRNPVLLLGDRESIWPE